MYLIKIPEDHRVNGESHIRKDLSWDISFRTDERSQSTHFRKKNTMVPMFVTPKFIYSNLIPKIIVLGSRTIGKELGHDGKAFINESNSLITKI